MYMCNYVMLYIVICINTCVLYHLTGDSAKLSIEKAFGMWRMWTCLTFVQDNEYNKVKFEIYNSGYVSHK